MNLVVAQQVALDNALNTIKKIKDTDAYRLKLDKKKCRIDTEVFCEILKICLIPPNQDFVKPPSEDGIVPFIQELGYSGKCDMLSAIHTNQMQNPGEHLLLLSIGASLGRRHDLIGSENQELKSCGKYGALIPDEMTNQDIKDSNAYKTYHDFATRKPTPKNARKFKKVASPSKKLSPILEEEPAVKPKHAKKHAKKSTTMPIECVVIKDTPGMSVSKKKAPTNADRGKGKDLRSEAALLEATQLKKTLKKRKLETYKLHASGSGDGVGSQPKVPDESEDKTTGIDEGTGTKPGVPNVPKYLSESENESWGDSDDDSNNDDSDDATNDDDDDDVDSDADGYNKASDNEKTDSDEDESPNLNQNKDEEKEYEEEYGRTPDNFEFTDDDEEYKELYKDVKVRLKATENEEEGKGDAEITDAGRDDGTQQTTYEQVKDDEHVILTTVHDTQKTKVPLQSSSISSDFACQFLNVDNVLPIDTEVVS
ncbi:hypothetical protein Tco_0785211, partial [Tanacetum coccineum]